MNTTGTININAVSPAIRYSGYFLMKVDTPAEAIHAVVERVLKDLPELSESRQSVEELDITFVLDKFAYEEI